MFDPKPARRLNYVVGYTRMGGYGQMYKNNKTYSKMLTKKWSEAQIHYLEHFWSHFQCKILVTFLRVTILSHQE